MTQRNQIRLEDPTVARGEREKSKCWMA